MKSDAHQPFLDLISGRRIGLVPSILRGVLSAGSIIYSGLVRARAAAYGAGIVRSHRAHVPVISIGNLTTGGTGKTPAVIWCAKNLLDAGRMPAVVLRGYRATAAGSDEANLLGRLLSPPFVPTPVPIVVNPDRVDAARSIAIDHPAVDVILLDDAFQHLRIRRDLDVVCVDCTNPFGFGRVLPRGLLREPVTALRRAGVVLLTRCDLVSRDEVNRIRRRIEPVAPGVPIVESSHQLVGVRGEQSSEPVGWLRGRRAVAVCGIGRPEAFFRTLTNAGVELVETIALPDHATIDQAAWDEASRIGRAKSAEVILTTAKDVARSGSNWPRAALPVWSAEVELSLNDADAETFVGCLKAAIE